MKRIRVKSHIRKGKRIRAHIRTCGSHPKIGKWVPKKSETKAQKPEGTYTPRMIEDLFFEVTKKKRR